MKRKGFTPTTAILIAVLLVPVYIIAQKVTPPPPGPPEPPKTVTPAASSGGEAVKDITPKMDVTQQRAEMEKKYRQMSQKQMAARAKAPKFNPSAMDIKPDYWKDHADGDAGIKQTQKQVEEAKAEQAKIAAEQKSAPKSATEMPGGSAGKGKAAAINE